MRIYTLFTEKYRIFACRNGKDVETIAHAGGIECRVADNSSELAGQGHCADTRGFTTAAICRTDFS